MTTRATAKSAPVSLAVLLLDSGYGCLTARVSNEADALKESDEATGASSSHERVDAEHQPEP
jgi:hypothetical protein